MILRQCGALDDILSAGPFGGTNMVEGIRTGISELMGLGTSEKRADAVKVEFLVTDGFPTLPIGGSKRVTAEDTNLAINAGRLAGKAGIKVHVFALGEEALSYPRAAVGIAKESGGTYTPVSRPADVLAVVENISVVGVDYVQIVNQTLGKKATHMRLAADGFFSSAVPVTEGRGHQFLRHIERTRVIVHVVDLFGEDPVRAYQQVRKELEAYCRGLAERPEVVVANKVDLGSPGERLKELRAAVDRDVVPISGVTGECLPRRVQAIVERL